MLHYNLSTTNHLYEKATNFCGVPGGIVRPSPINTGSPTEAACQACGQTKPVEQFPVRNDRSGRYRPYCAGCARDAQRARYAAHKKQQPFKLKVTRARSRAQHLRVPFDLTAVYLESLWTGTCPVIGQSIHLAEVDRSDEFAAELDRFIPALGYVKGNVAFLSRRANRLKNNTTTTELKQLLNWMEQHETAKDIR